MVWNEDNVTTSKRRDLRVVLFIGMKAWYDLSPYFHFLLARTILFERTFLNTISRHRSLFSPVKCLILDLLKASSSPFLSLMKPFRDITYLTFFSCSAARLPFGSFIIFILIIRRILLSLSTLSLRLLFNTRFGHCSKVRKGKMAVLISSFGVYFKSM